MRCPGPSSSPAARTSLGLDSGMMRSEASGTPARWSRGVHSFAGALQLRGWCKGQERRQASAGAPQCPPACPIVPPCQQTIHHTTTRLSSAPHLPRRRGASGTGWRPSSSAHTPPQYAAPPVVWREAGSDCKQRLRSSAFESIRAQTQLLEHKHLCARPGSACTACMHVVAEASGPDCLSTASTS